MNLAMVLVSVLVCAVSMMVRGHSLTSSKTCAHHTFSPSPQYATLDASVWHAFRQLRLKLVSPFAPRHRGQGVDKQNESSTFHRARRYAFSLVKLMVAFDVDQFTTLKACCRPCVGRR